MLDEGELQQWLTLLAAGGSKLTSQDSAEKKLAKITHREGKDSRFHCVNINLLQGVKPFITGAEIPKAQVWDTCPLLLTPYVQMRTTVEQNAGGSRKVSVEEVNSLAGDTWALSLAILGLGSAFWIALTASILSHHYRYRLERLNAV